MYNRSCLYWVSTRRRESGFVTMLSLVCAKQERRVSEREDDRASRGNPRSETPLRDPFRA